MATDAPGDIAVTPGGGQPLQPATVDGGGSEEGPAVSLPLVIGVAVAAVVVLIGVIILILWKTGKLKRKGPVMRKSPGRRKDGTIPSREERKKSIMVVGPSNKAGCELYIVRHYYAAEDSNQLTLETGRIVEVVEKMDNGWWRGVTGDQEGWFPATFVKKIEVSDTTSALVDEDGGMDPDATMQNHKPPGSHTRSKPPDTKPAEACFINAGFIESAEEEAKKREKQGLEKSAEGKRISLMENEDIEGYLNEIFSVEDETTPSETRKNQSNKTSNNKQNKGTSSKNSKLFLHKKKKDEENTKKLKEHAHKSDNHSHLDLQNIKNIKLQNDSKGLDVTDSGNGVKGSPLINPIHYMISSSESLISTSSCNEDTASKSNNVKAGMDVQKKVLKKSSPEKQTSSDEQVSPSGGEDQDVFRGTPDGSSLQDVLPDSKELTLGADTGIEADLDTTDDSLGDKLDNVTSSAQVPDTKHKKERRDSFVVMYPFTPSDNGQLTLSRNEVVVALGGEENGWIKGRKRDTEEEGWFPRSYVREAKSPVGREEGSDDSDSYDSEGEFDDITGLEYRALYMYEAQQEGDLTLAEGDTVIVLGTQENGWWRGCIGEQEGWFPATYVQAVPQTPASASIYEDIGSPFHMGAPLSTSSPIDIQLDGKFFSKDETETKKILPEIEDAITPVKATSVKSAAPTPSSDKEPSNEASSSFKPHVPRRFVKPKLVKMPRQSSRRGANKKGNQKPSRPPPPLPRGSSQENSVYQNTEDVQKLLDSMDRSLLRNKVKGDSLQRNKVKGDSKVMGDKKRKSLPRPSVAPPPAPIPGVVARATNGDMPLSLPKTEHDSLRSDHDASMGESGLNDNTDENISMETNKEVGNYSDKSHDSNLTTDKPEESSWGNRGETELYIQDTSLYGMLFEDTSSLLEGKMNSTLPGVHRSSVSPEKLKVTVHDDSGKNSQHDEVSGAQSFNQPQPVKQGSQDSSDASNISAHSDNSMSFNAIMNIFESIANKADSSTDNSGLAESINSSLKPPVPPKPNEKALKYRRSQSDPDIMRLRSVPLFSLPQNNGKTGHSQNSENQSSVQNSKPSEDKSKLPKRPPYPPKRSTSLGSLIVNGLSISGTENIDEKISDEKTIQTGASIQDSTPAHNEPALKVEQNEKVHVANNTNTHVDKSSPSPSFNEHLERKKDSPKRPTPPKSKVVRNTPQTKPTKVSEKLKNNGVLSDPSSDSQSLKLNIGKPTEDKDNSPTGTPPPRPSLPPGKSPLSDLGNSSSPHQVKSSSKEASVSPAGQVEPSKYKYSEQSQRPQDSPQDSPTISVPKARDMKHEVQPIQSSLPQMHNLRQIDQGLVRVSPRTQRQKILSNGSLRMSNSPDVRYTGRRSPRSGLDSLNSSMSSLDTSHESIDKIDPPPLPLTSPPEFFNEPPRRNATEESQSDILAPPPKFQNLTMEVRSPPYNMESSMPKAVTLPTQVHVPPPLRRVTSPVHIKTNPMRFFTPLGYSKSPSSSSISSANNMSPMTMSPGSVTRDSYEDKPGSQADSGFNGLDSGRTVDSDVESLTASNSSLSRYGVVFNQESSLTNSRESLSLRNSTSSPLRSPVSMEGTNPMRFFSPVAFNARRGSVDDANKGMNSESSQWRTDRNPDTHAKYNTSPYSGPSSDTSNVNVHVAQPVNTQSDNSLSSTSKWSLTKPKSFNPSPLRSVPISRITSENKPAYPVSNGHMGVKSENSHNLSKDLPPSSKDSLRLLSSPPPAVVLRDPITSRGSSRSPGHQRLMLSALKDNGNEESIV